MEEKKEKTNQWSQPKPWHADQLKQHNQRPVNTVFEGPEPHDSQSPANRGGGMEEEAVEVAEVECPRGRRCRFVIFIGHGPLDK